MLAGETPELLEYRIIDSRGTTRWLHQRSVLVRNENGDLENVEGIITDLTERRRADEQRQRLQEQVQHTQKLESLDLSQPADQ